MSVYTDENKMIIDELWHGQKEDDEYVTDCALCGNEVDEETTVYGICEKCWTDHHNFDNALAYGKTARVDVSVNGLFAKVLTPDQINEALQIVFTYVRKAFPYFAEREAQSFLRDDDGDFADWLKAHKNID